MDSSDTTSMCTNIKYVDAYIQGLTLEFKMSMKSTGNTLKAHMETSY